VSEWGPCPPLYPLEDEQVIDLGKRKVRVYACHGHTPGSITLLDENSRTLFLGDACNCNLLLRSPRGSHRFVSVEKALFYLKRLQSLRPKYDRYFNGHYDFRPLGQPLGEDVLPDAITACEQIVAGTAEVEVSPARLPGAQMVHSVKVGRTRVTFNPDGIRES
jgi:hydroxyacylglutathione hydrolase